MSCPQVLIVGSGPAGLIAALALVKNGVPVRIIEKDAQHHVGSRGPGLQPRVLEVFYFLGILDDIQKIASPLPLRKFYDNEDPHRVVKSVKLLQEINPTPAYPITTPVMLGQHRNQETMRKHLEALGVTVELGSALVNCEQDETGVTAEIAISANGVETKEKTKYAYLIGTDGARSIKKNSLRRRDLDELFSGTVRKALGVNFLGETREDERVYIADVQAEGLENKDLHFWGKPSEAMVSLRHTGEPNSFQMFLAGLKLDLASLRTNGKDGLQSELNRIIKRTDIKITNVTWQSEWRANIRMAEHFRVGRAFLAGDAAHAHSPAGGQGLNTSIMDAFNLAWKLALVLNSYAKLSLLDSYESERLPVVSEMLNISTKLHGESLGARGDTIENLKLADQNSPWHRGWKLFQLDVNYRWSNVVFDERYKQVERKAEAYGIEGHDIRAGDRSPDAPGLIIARSGSGGEGDKTRLFDIFKPTKHTILILLTDADANKSLSWVQPVISKIEKLAPGLFTMALIIPNATPDGVVPNVGVDYVLKDSDGHAFKNFGLEGKSYIVIVRPDGIVGAFASDVAGVEHYLSLVFL